jgi:hypothetical protein
MAMGEGILSPLLNVCKTGGLYPLCGGANVGGNLPSPRLMKLPKVKNTPSPYFSPHKNVDTLSAYVLLGKKVTGQE